MTDEQKLIAAGLNLEGVESGTYCYGLKSKPERGDIWQIVVYEVDGYVDNVFIVLLDDETDDRDDTPVISFRELPEIKTADDVLTLARLLGLSKEVE
jgi:meiotically up-regulated gene 157 (Mug157) protein